MKYPVSPMHGLALLFACLFAQITSFSQQGDIYDTVYYKDQQKVRKKYADYFRIPAVKDSSNHYITTYYSMKGWPLRTVSYKAVKIDYHLSIEEGVGVMDGHFIYYDHDGAVIAEGYCKDDKKVGEWRYYYNYKDGQPEGLAARDVYMDDRPFHYRTVYNRNGTKLREGGYLEVPFKTSTVFVRHETWKFYDEDSGKLVKMLVYDKSRLEGLCIYWSRKTHQKTIKGKYEHGKRVGEWQYFDAATGNLVATENYTDGYMQGEKTVYDPASGKVKLHGYYNGGFRSGTWKSYFMGTDSIESEAHYSKGKGDIRYFDSSSGKLITVGSLSADRRSGHWLHYFPGTTKVATEEDYDDNMLNGAMKTYDYEGRIIASVDFRKGVPDGVFLLNYPEVNRPLLKMLFKADTLLSLQSFDRTGHELRKRKYEHGNLASEECFEPDGTKAGCPPILEIATFKGDLMKYINDNMEYPEAAMDAGLEGKVQLSFVVDENGKVQDVTVTKGADDLLNDEAIRLISQTHDWEPAHLESLRIKSYMTLTVVFALPQDTDPGI